MPDVLLKRDGHVATLTLNRPERLNAISGPMLELLSEHLTACDADREVRVIVLTGAGRGFCAGLDLVDTQAGGSPIADPFNIGNTPPFVLRRIDTPTLCALNGPAAGYGMDLALGCDLLIASERAKFACPVKRGVIPESGGTWILPRLVGWQKACEIVLVGRTLDAGRIRELGLANAVVPHEGFEEEVHRWVNELAANAPLAVSAAKRTMRLGLDTPFDANSHHVMAELLALLRSKDFAEGMAAFLAKRPPNYEGH